MTTITLTDSELAAYREGRLKFLVRLAEECPQCEGTGDCDSGWAECDCLNCGGTGYVSPLGSAGDVLFHQEEWLVSGWDDYDDADDGPTIEVEVGLASPDENHWATFPANRAPALPEQYEIQPADAMPEWASRIRLPRTDEGRVVRLQQVNRELWMDAGYEFGSNVVVQWNRNNPDHPWSSNPWVGVGGIGT